MSQNSILQAKIDVSHLRSGVYFLKLEEGKKGRLFKFIKEWQENACSFMIDLASSYMHN